MFNIEQALAWLRGLDALAGLPMIVFALGLMLGGYRISRAAVVFTLAAVGAAGAWQIPTDYRMAPWFAVGGALVLGAGGFALKRHGVVLLGGLVGMFVASYLVKPLGLQDWALWAALALAGLSVAAMCLTSHQTVVVIVTSFEGAVLLVAGVVSLIASSPPLYRFFESTNRSYSVFLPFVLLVPTLIGCFLQLGDIKNRGEGAPG